MSDWRDVLKMPPRVSVAQDRDADYTQKIIEYDEKVISPKFEEHIRSQPMNTRVNGFIATGGFDGKDVFRVEEGIPRYLLSRDTVKSLGSNAREIMVTLEEQYKQAGYTTKVDRFKLVFYKPSR
tara:strand:- start:275 stop:646 length:372 start_codon:yes stop_codon:yes gene_type:complete